MQTMTPQQELQETMLERLPERGRWSESGYHRLADHGVFPRGERAAAALPLCLAVDISAVIDAR